MTQLQQKLRDYLLSEGASDVGFCLAEDSDFGDCRFAVSVVVRLSQAIVGEIRGEPTHTYFNHYRTVNAFIDGLLLRAGLFLQRNGYRYITVAASQSINKDGWSYKGRYSHKKAAVLSGLGTVGKNSLFIHKDYGAAVRLGTVFTDCPFECREVEPAWACLGCNRCVDACPAGAITGNDWKKRSTREEMFFPDRCSEYMKKRFQHIGRGAVCGICMAVCPMLSDGLSVLGVDYPPEK